MSSARKTLEYKPDPDKFDLITHRWDNQGRLIAKNPYRKFIMNGAEYYERPVNSGNLWLENNKPAGRVLLEFNEKGHIAKKTFDFEAAHVAYSEPPTGAEMVSQELEAERKRNAALEMELRAMRAEREAKEAPVKKEVKNFAPEAKAAPPKLSKTE